MTDGKAFFSLSNERWEQIFKGRSKLNKVLKAMDPEVEIGEEEDAEDDEDFKVEIDEEIE